MSPNQAQPHIRQILEAFRESKITALEEPIKVLLVEDNPDDALLIKRSLSNAVLARIFISHVSSLAGAIEHLSHHSTDVVLLDLTLPDVKGLATIHETRKAAPHVPIIVLTGLADEGIAVKAVERGVQDYLVKGQVESSTIARSIQHALARKMANATVHTMEEHLRQIQKMEAIGRLAGGVAHDFNNLLTAIGGFCDLQKARLKEIGELPTYLEEVTKAVEKAAALTRQLLAFSRKQVIQPKVLVLNNIVLEMEKMLHRLIGEDIEFVVRLAPDLWRTKVDPGQMEQVILNLAINARDAMPRGGRLLIETANAELNPLDTQYPPEAEAGPYVMLSVADTGMGMDEKTLSRIFEPFFTTKEPGRGTGLGLATVYGIVKQGGGTLTVRSEPGKGTTFRVFLPRSKESGMSFSEITRRSQPRGGSETILVVEDDASIRKLVQEIVRIGGYAVLAARNGAEALTVASQHQGPIHLLLTDVVMPEVGGQQLAEKLALLRPEVRVLYMSGYSSKDAADEVRLELNAPLVRKPFSAESLKRAIRQVLDMNR